MAQSARALSSAQFREAGNGFGNETRRNGRDGVERGVMAWTGEKS